MLPKLLLAFLLSNGLSFLQTFGAHTQVKEKNPTVNAWELKGSKLISYIVSYKADDATGEVLPRSSSLMKAANLCVASGMFKKDKRPRKNGEEPVVLRGAKFQPYQGYEHSKHWVLEHLFWLLWLSRQQ